MRRGCFKRKKKRHPIYNALKGASPTNDECSGYKKSSQICSGWGELVQWCMAYRESAAMLASIPDGCTFQYRGLLLGSVSGWIVSSVSLSIILQRVDKWYLLLVFLCLKGLKTIYHLAHSIRPNSVFFLSSKPGIGPRSRCMLGKCHTIEVHLLFRLNWCEFPIIKWL